MGKRKFAFALFVGILLIPIRTIEVKTNNPVEIITQVAKANGIKPIDLLGIAAQESSFGKFQIGDKGCSIGFFQINICANQDAKGIIGNLANETQWVATRLNDLGYQTDNRRAIAAYNRPANPNYKYEELVEKRISEIASFIN
jgi:hypothetical protein